MSTIVHTDAILALNHSQSYIAFIAREAEELEHDAAKTTGSRFGPILLILNDWAYVT